ncbi:MAG: hypothetical protein JSU94_02490 [Phycisphaerales bacterium]|nr:MAG: hypothetical protein JSU94_02490 [Phycisphaerales bacterium]
MGIDYRKERLTIAAVALFVASVVLGVLTVIKLQALASTSVRAGDVVERAVTGGEPDANDVERHVEKAKAAADELKKKNLFAPPPPRVNPIKEVKAIFGDYAYINGDWRQAGDKIGDANIVAIEPTRVKVEWDGKIHFLAPLNAAGPAAQAPVKPPTVKEKPEVKKVEAEVVQGAAAPVVEDDPLAFIGVPLSPRVRALLLEKWNQVPEEERQKAKEEWSKMDDEQKRQAIEAMERHL